MGSANDVQTYSRLGTVSESLFSQSFLVFIVLVPAVLISMILYTVVYLFCGPCLHGAYESWFFFFLSG